MALITYTVDELSEDLKINDAVIAYAEDQNGPGRNTRYGKRYDRVRLGLQVSPENFFYDAGQWAGAAYVNLKALEFTMTSGTAKAGFLRLLNPSQQYFRVRARFPQQATFPGIANTAQAYSRIVVTSLLPTDFELA